MRQFCKTHVKPMFCDTSLPLGPAKISIPEKCIFPIAAFITVSARPISFLLTKIMASILAMFHFLVFISVSEWPISCALTRIKVSILTIVHFVVVISVAARPISFALKN